MSFIVVILRERSDRKDSTDRLAMMGSLRRCAPQDDSRVSAPQDDSGKIKRSPKEEAAREEWSPNH